MRPVRLEIEGFAAFRERAVLDFEGVDLVAFTGPTGAGKSSIIDAMTFALYGSVARYNDARKVAPVIHQLASEARVRLDFDSAGQRFAVTRVVRRQTPGKGSKRSPSASTKEARLERLEPDEKVLAGTVGELDRAVPELLGLDFEQFTRTIVLPQGEFARFLRDDQADRDKLLQRLLDLGIYERMGQQARSRARRAADQIEVYQERHRRNPPPDEATIAELVSGVDRLRQLRVRVTDQLAELRELDQVLDPLRREVTEIDEALQLVESMDLPSEVDDFAADIERLGASKTEADQALSEARTARDQARVRLAALPDRAALNKMQSVLAQLAEAREERADYEGELASVAARLDELADESAGLEADVVEAEQTLRRTRTEADAAAWVAVLEVGQACPVCRQTVDALPDHDPSAELVTAEERLHDVTQRARTASRELARLGERCKVINREIERGAERIELLELQQSSWAEPLEADAIAAALETTAQAERAVTESEQSVAEAERHRDGVGAELDRLTSVLDGHRQRLAQARDTVAHLQPPVLSHGSLTDDLALLGSWRADRLTAEGKRRADVARRGKELAEQRRTLVASLSEAAAACDLQAAPDDLAATVAEALARGEAELEAARLRQREHADDAARMAELEADRVVDDELGRHLRSGKFTSWLLAEAVDAIVDKASVWLRELSNQQYSLRAGDRSFAIVDHHNADQEREVRTLSGGETFLASLALALALADSVADLAPVDAPGLDSMFLDEGFGTLDPATLDVVATAIEELASGGRMIGIVTHVADLADRMPARFRVQKGPSTSTVELVEG
jgi:exonuclease SbcC